MIQKWFRSDTSKRSLGKLVKGASAAVGLGAIVTYDLLQKRSGILRNYPIIGHGRGLLLKIRPQIQQYFIERDWDGRPFDKTSRELIYSRSRDDKSEESFGTVHDVTAQGKEWFVHSITPVKPLSTPPRVRVGGAECTKPYEMALLNVSSMSYGSLSANAIRALNAGAAKGEFAHDTGEGGISPHHLAGGGDLVWELGTAYFGARTKDGEFDPVRFAEKASMDAVKMVSLKLSQGAKPGIGGVLPKSKLPKKLQRSEVSRGIKNVLVPRITLSFQLQWNSSNSSR